MKHAFGLALAVTTHALRPPTAPPAAPAAPTSTKTERWIDTVARVRVNAPRDDCYAAYRDRAEILPVEMCVVPQEDAAACRRRNISSNGLGVAKRKSRSGGSSRHRRGVTLCALSLERTTPQRPNHQLKRSSSRRTVVCQTVSVSPT